MALDWSKDISFSGMKKMKSQGKMVYPSKRYINLVPRKEKSNDWKKALPIALVLLVLFALFVKFGIYDFYAKVDQANARLANKTHQLATLAEANAGYDALKAEYDAYESSKLSSSSSAVSAMEAMELVDSYVAPVAKVSSMKYENNTIKLVLGDIPLDQVGSLASALNGNEIVTNVSVSTAASEGSSDADRVTAAMVITVKKA